METKKIATACFIGGTFCCTIALLFTPDYWWLGIAAGIAGGYLSYEFRDVCKTFIATFRFIGIELGYLKPWFFGPHPFMWAGAIITIPLVMFYYYPSFANDNIGSVEKGFLICLGFSTFILYISILLCSIATIGARMIDKCYWVPTAQESGVDQQKWFDELKAKGYKEVPLTHIAAIKWTLKGIYFVIKGFLQCICFFFKRIHSSKRLLCAIDGTLGGSISYLWFSSTSTSAVEQIALVIFGGLLGALFGIANWEIVSKRVLKIAIKSA